MQAPKSVVEVKGLGVEQKQEPVVVSSLLCWTSKEEKSGCRKIITEPNPTQKLLPYTESGLSKLKRTLMLSSPGGSQPWPWKCKKPSCVSLCRKNPAGVTVGSRGWEININQSSWKAAKRRQTRLPKCTEICELDIPISRQDTPLFW
jgi:hypothetical protein